MNIEQYEAFFAAHQEIHRLAYEYAALLKSMDKKLGGKYFDDDQPIEIEKDAVIVPWSETWGGSTDYGSITILAEALIDQDKWIESIGNHLEWEAECDRRQKEEEKQKAEEKKKKAKEKAIADAKALLKSEGLMC